MIIGRFGAHTEGNKMSVVPKKIVPVSQYDSELISAALEVAADEARARLRRYGAQVSPSKTTEQMLQDRIYAYVRLAEQFRGD